jgi:hypothetical protein
MGFALWIDGDVAWAEGTHEYRPMGAGTVAITDRFRRRDFRPRRRSPSRRAPTFIGLFASLEDLNRHLGRVARVGVRPTGRVTPPHI